jgi:hypothetical protein
MTTAPDDLTEIIADVDYRIDQIWLKIRREAVLRQAKADPADIRATAAQFGAMGETATAIVEHVFAYVLDICRSREIRPADLVPQAAKSLTLLCRGLVDYGRDRIQAGGDARQIKAAASRAAGAVQKHIQLSAREAMLGYAGGKAVFPRADWPDGWFRASTRKAAAGGLFLLGMAAGALAMKAFGGLIP